MKEISRSKGREGEKVARDLFDFEKEKISARESIRERTA